MGDPVICVDNLGKRYRIGARPEDRYVALRDVLARSLQSMVKRSPPSPKTDFWALQQVSFEVKEGDRVGIIGRNGAGKSTLLKLLSRITEPTTGRIRLRGRVASLLEVGTGFHPELTGRENIFLNGAILGMGRAEIRRKFDDIVDFAEVEAFLDTPVKRYSSGMYVRLAFAVAAHLEPEILLVDEVLAVGDARFQRKCLGKMEAVSREGRTILFVSHSMPTIASLCSRCILLDAGRIALMGPTADVVMAYYTEGNSSPAAVDCTRRSPPVGDECAILLSGCVRNAAGRIVPEVGIDEAVAIVLQFRVLQGGIAYVPNLHVLRADGTCAFITCATECHPLPAGDYVAECNIPQSFLNDGAYFVGLALSSFERGVRVHFFEPSALSFNVRDPIAGTRTRVGYTGPIAGAVRPHLPWHISSTSSPP